LPNERRNLRSHIVGCLASANVAFTFVSRQDQANETVRAAQALGVKALAIQADSADDSAVFDATGALVRSLPLTPEKIKAARENA
jgi:3-oxoacyl-[acyl-carrier protein] reductase